MMQRKVMLPEMQQNSFLKKFLILNEQVNVVPEVSYFLNVLLLDFL